MALAAALPAYAQQSSTDPNPTSSATPAATSATSATPPTAATPPTSATSSATSAATAPAASADKTGPSAELIKRAKAAGFRPETHNGQMQFCTEDASLGSRFTTKKCYDEQAMNMLITNREAEQQNLRQLKTPSGTR
jgi:hypothetical protein